MNEKQKKMCVSNDEMKLREKKIVRLEKNLMVECNLKACTQ